MAVQLTEQTDKLNLRISAADAYRLIPTEIRAFLLSIEIKQSKRKILR